MDYSKSVPEFAASFEGYSSIATHHPEDPPETWTMGFGSTYWDGKRVLRGMSCTRDEALLQLARGLDSAERCLEMSLDVPLTQGETDGCVDLIYNIGCGRWLESTARARLNAGDYHGAASAFKMWDRAGGVVMAGLLRRRVAEEKVFNAKGILE